MPPNSKHHWLLHHWCTSHSFITLDDDDLTWLLHHWLMVLLAAPQLHFTQIRRHFTAMDEESHSWTERRPAVCSVVITSYHVYDDAEGRMYMVPTHKEPSRLILSMNVSLKMMAYRLPIQSLDWPFLPNFETNKSHLRLLLQTRTCTGRREYLLRDKRGRDVIKSLKFVWFSILENNADTVWASLNQMYHPNNFFFACDMSFRSEFYRAIREIRYTYMSEINKSMFASIFVLVWI